MAKRPDLQELGSSGLKRYSGIIYEEILPELSGYRWRKVVRQMVENDPVIASLLFAIEMLVRNVSWDMQAASEDNEAMQAKEFFAGALFEDTSISWKDTLAEILTFLWWGYSYMELVYKIRSGPSGDPHRNSKFSDGRIGWRKWVSRAQETLLRWEFDDSGGVQAFTQLPPPDFQTRTIPIEKALLFRTTVHKANPEGRSLLRWCWTSWYAKTNIQRIEGIGIERDLAGLPVLFGPPEIFSADASDADKAIFETLKQIATNIHRDEQEGLVMPMAYDESGKPLYDIKLLSTGGQRQFDTDKIINRHDQRILMTVMADFLLLGHQKVGSFALSDSKTDMFATAMGAWLQSIAEVVNRYAIPRLGAFNGIKPELLPKLTHGSIESVNLAELSDYVSKLSGANIILTPEQQNWVLEQGGFPITKDV